MRPLAERRVTSGGSYRGASALAVVLALVALWLAASSLAVPLTQGAPSEPAAGTTVFLNVSTTETILFAPNTLSVEPGQSVHLIVTQLADFNHTFTLSPVANFTFPTSDTTADLNAFFATHTPLVNLSLGSTMGAKFYANFTAPPPGSYEYVCLQPTHFASGMHGELDSGMSTGSTSGSPASPTIYVIAGAVVAVIVVAAVVGMVMRRRPGPPAP